MSEENEELIDEADDKKKHGKRYGKHIADVRREAFVGHVIDATLIAERTGEKIDYRKCAELAGYPTGSAKQMAYYLRGKSDVQDQIRVRLAAAGISDAEIIGVPASIVRFSLADVIDVYPDGGWELNLHKAISNGAITAVKKLGQDAKGRPYVEMYDKLRAADLLSSIRGLKRADVKPDDLALRRMAIEDDIRAFREKMFIQSNGDAAFADEAAEKYRAHLAKQDDFRPYMKEGDPNDRTRDDDPAS